MKKKVTYLLVITFIFTLLGIGNAQKKTIITTREDIGGREVEVKIKTGEHWFHKLQVIPFLPFIKVKNSPQIAVWIEDSQGKYLETLYVTKRVAKQDWRKAPGDPTDKEEIRRKSALPYWGHKRGVKYKDGAYLPTTEKPLPDAVTSATPEQSFKLISSMDQKIDKFIVKVEINNSADFNQYYPESAVPGDDNYSGGKWGSGQPALIYAAEVDIKKSKEIYPLKIIGHSSPDGETGKLYTDTSQITTAKNIVDEIVLKIMAG